MSPLAESIPARPFGWTGALWLLAVALSVVPATLVRAQVIAFYSFDDGTATDASGHGYNGTAVNAVYTESGYSGGAFLFNGSNAYIQIDGLDINPSVYPQLTMGAWVLADSASPIRQIISHDNGGFDRSLGIDYRGGLTGWSTFTGNGVLANSPVTTGAWTFLAVAYDQVAGTATLYVDGHAVTGSAAGGSGWNFARIGMNPSFGEYFSGKIDSVFFVAAALTAPQLDQIRLNGIPAVPEPSVFALLVVGLAVAATTARRFRPRR